MSSTKNETEEKGSKFRKRVLSGVQPSGKLHLGNYFGAIRQHIALQDEGECFYFIADYHSMTTISDGKTRRENTNDVALDYLALGLDPAKAAFFRQSDVPEVCELSWIFACMTNMGLIERAVSYKDKVARGLVPNVGLFTYPILMTADILIYRSTLVPVGEDQIHNIEITRDIAQRFNHAVGEEVFPMPNYRLDQVAKVPGLDGQKMSKSYGNTIDLFAEGSALKKTVMSIVTDSTPLESPKDPARCNVFALYQLFASPEEQEEMANAYRQGGFGYGEAKKRLLQKINDYFGPFREKRRQLVAQKDFVEDVLREGARVARNEARKTIDVVRELTGLGRM